MEKNMEGPERITVARHIGTGCHDIMEYGLDMSMGYVDAVEYIRADLVEDADMAECAAFLAGYEAGEAGRSDPAAPSAPAEVEGLLGVTYETFTNPETGEIYTSYDPWIAKEDVATALTTLQAENERLRGERDALAVAVREIKEAWDWWREDSYDRCSSVVEDAVSAAHAKLEGEV